MCVIIIIIVNIVSVQLQSPLMLRKDVADLIHHYIVLTLGLQ